MNAEVVSEAVRALQASLALHHGDLLAIIAGERLELWHPIAGRTSTEYGDPDQRTALGLEFLKQQPITPERLVSAAALIRQRPEVRTPSQVTTRAALNTLEAHLRATQRGVLAPLPELPADAPCLLLVTPTRTTLVVSAERLSLLLDYEGDGP